MPRAFLDLAPVEDRSYVSFRGNLPELGPGPAKSQQPGSTPGWVWSNGTWQMLNGALVDVSPSTGFEVK